MSIQLERDDDATIVRILETRIDAGCCEAMRRDLASALAADPDHLIIDLSRVRSIDSSGIGTLASTGKRMRTGAQLHVVGPTKAVRTIFSITRLDRVLPIHDDIASARDAISKQD